MSCLSPAVRLNSLACPRHHPYAGFHGSSLSSFVVLCPAMARLAKQLGPSLEPPRSVWLLPVYRRKKAKVAFPVITTRQVGLGGPRAHRRLAVLWADVSTLV